MLAMSSPSSFSSHQSNNNLPFPTNNLGSSSSSPWPLLLDDDPLMTLLPNLDQATLFPPQPHYSSSSPPPPLPAAVEDQLVDGGGSSGTTVKKLNHNASERQRRKKINTLYSSLRSLLPTTGDHHHHPTKKLSIPTTVSRVVKYIPELQQQVETLALKKKQLLSTFCPKPAEADVKDRPKSDRGTTTNRATSKHANYASSKLLPSSTVSTSWLSEEEVMVQVSVACHMTENDGTVPMSEVLLRLEEECKLVVLNSSSFRSPQGMAFYNLHLQVEGSRGVVMDSEGLSERILRLYEQGRSRFC